MTLHCIVTEMDGATVTVTPIKNASCATCHANCSSCASQFSVSNSKCFDVRPGQKVTLGMSAKHEALQSVFSLIFPLFSATLGFFAAHPLAALLGRKATESMQAFCSLLFLALACAIVMLAVRKKNNPEKLEIIAIC